MIIKKVNPTSGTLIDQFNPKKLIAVDTESTGVDVWGKSLPFMVAMCDEDGNTSCVSWEVNPFTREVTPNQIDVLMLKCYLENPKYEKVYHNSKFDVKMLSKIGIKTVGKIHDTLFQARVCFTLEMDYGLKFLSKHRLGIPDQDEKDLQEAVISARRKVQAYNRTHDVQMMQSSEPKEDYWLPKYFDKENTLCEKYCRLDVYRTMGLHMFYHDVMAEDPILFATYEKEMKLIWPIVNSMEDRGMKVFPEAVTEESKVCKLAMETHMKVMLSIIKEKKLLPFPKEKTTPPPHLSGSKFTFKVPEFNPSSPQQLMRVLYLPEGEGGLGLNTDRRNRKTGKVTTDKDTLRELMYEPFVRELAGYRAAKHTLNLFFDKFNVLMRKDSVERNSYCVHTGFNQCSTKTGRFSAANPNLMQASAGGAKSLSASYSSQKVFGPRDGYTWLGMDYSQQEGRIFAYLAQVPAMLEALNNGVDLFEAISNQVWGGKQNTNAVKAVIKALELTSTSIPENKAVKQVWETQNINPVSALKQADTIADNWLSTFDYNIVEAEKSLGKAACRQRAKHVTYAKIFGGGPGSYTHLLYCSLEEAKVFDVEYTSSMPEMKQFMKETERKARLDGYVINLYNRKLRVDSNFAYRGVSYVIQSSAADQTKEALIYIDAFIKRTTVDAHLIMTIHDSIYIEVLKKHLNNGFIRAVKSRMENSHGHIGIHIPTEVVLINERWSVNEEKWKG